MLLRRFYHDSLAQASYMVGCQKTGEALIVDPNRLIDQYTEAADREGLKSKRIHLFHLRGSSALDYESDIAIIMNNKYQIMTKDHVAFNPYTAKQFRDWVVWTIEKNRAGKAMLDIEFQLHGQHFVFDPRGQRVQQQLIDDKLIES